MLVTFKDQDSESTNWTTEWVRVIKLSTQLKAVNLYKRSFLNEI